MQLSVWCPFCREYHDHYWDEDMLPKDVKKPSCFCTNPASQFIKTGYYIGVEPKRKG